jgi:nitronate monooxygenase
VAGRLTEESCDEVIERPGPKTELPPLTIKGKRIAVPIIQGGMGIGVSLHPLAAAVASEGGVGIISSACLDRLVSKRTGKKTSNYEAVMEEISLSKAQGGITGINIMVALVRDYSETVRAAIDAEADFIISGGGLPMNLPAIQKPNGTALVPIVSSARALQLIIRKWEKASYRPDAVVLEGPLAGGHLGFRIDEIDLESNKLENLLPPVKEMAMKNGDFPVIVAGGLYSHEDIVRFLRLGADGVQMGTRFLTTEESSATAEYKQAVIDSREGDVLIAHRPGSPCGLPFRVLKGSPMFVSSLLGARKPKCDKGYLLLKDSEGTFSQCSARQSNEVSFCICNGLLSSGGYNTELEEPLYTAGAIAWKVDKMTSVKALMRELSGVSDDSQAD